MTGNASQAVWIRRTVLAALPALLTRPSRAQARTGPGRSATAPPVVLILGEAETATWTPALLEAGCAPLGPVHPADLPDAVAFARAAPGAPRIAVLGPANLVDAQAARAGISLFVRLAPQAAPISARTLVTAATALLNDDPLSKAHAVLLAAEDGRPNPGGAASVLTLTSAQDLPRLTLALEALSSPSRA